MNPDGIRSRIKVGALIYEPRKGLETLEIITKFDGYFFKTERLIKGSGTTYGMNYFIQTAIGGTKKFIEDTYILDNKILKLIQL